jgi:dolichol-phosphate mannosyltransferase
MPLCAARKIGISLGVCIVNARSRFLDADQLWRGLAIAIAAYAFVLRVAYALQVELLPEETYYWNYARHLDYGYLDHPPMVAWLIKAGTLGFGDTSFGVRFGALCCGVATSFFVFRLTRNVFGETSAWAALVLTQLLPFFFMSGLLMTPDAPLSAAWAASLYFLERALIARRSEAWPWVGFTLGVGLLSKYTIAMLGLSAFIFLLLDVPSRHWLSRRQPYVAACIAAFVFLPVLVWNAQHEWASFLFQTSRRLAERPRFSLHKLIGGALVLITPVGAIALCAARFKSSSADGRARRLLGLALLVPLVVFFFFSLRHEVKLDWTGAPWVAALPILGCGLAQACSGQPTVPQRWLRWAWPPMLGILAVVYAVGWLYLVLGIAGLGYSRQTELVPIAWQDFGRQVSQIAGQLRATYGERLLVVGMDRYAIASEVAFYSSDQSAAVASTSTSHLFDGVGLMYERWFPARMQSGRPLLLVSWDRGSLEAPLVRDRVGLLKPIVEGSLIKNDLLVRHFYYRVALGYDFEKNRTASR